MKAPTAYPLSWPLRQPRAKWRQPSRFLKPYKSVDPRTNAETRSGQRFHTVADATKQLEDELERLGAKDAVLSTNLPQKAGGGPRGDAGNPADPGAAVYFKLDGEQVVFACDKWQRVACNIYAIALHIGALRGMDRWGVGRERQAFTGYLALEAQTQPKWFEILECNETDPEKVIDGNRRRLLARYHPDGQEPDLDKFRAIGEAYRVAMELRGK